MAKDRNLRQHAQGNTSVPLATAAALDSAMFSKIHALDAIPAAWMSGRGKRHFRSCR